jgi:hypothetical protein
VGTPLSMICGATGSCTRRWQHLRAHLPRMWRCTKNSAGTTSSRSLTSSPTRTMACPQSGVGRRCSKDEPREAGPDEVWRAEQCLRVLAALPSIESAGPAPVRAAVRALCSEPGAVSSLAFRAGAPKSVLTQWLKHEAWRLNFEQLLEICAVEEVDLGELLQGRVVASPTRPGCRRRASDGGAILLTTRRFGPRSPRP